LTSSPRARVLRLGLRVVALLVVAWLVARTLRWHDHVVLVDGTTLTGEVVETAGEVRVAAIDGGGAEVVPFARVRHATVGGREIPDVSYGFKTLLRRLSRSIPTVALVWCALVGFGLLTAWRWRWLVSALGLALSARDAVRFTFYGIFFNLVVPGATGGDVVKAWYAAKRTGVPTKAVVSVFVDRAVGLFALVLLAGSVLFLGPDRPGYAAPRLLVGVTLCGVGVFVLLVLSRRVRRTIGLSALLKKLPFQHVWAEVDAAFRLYRRKPGALGLGLLVSLCNHVGTCACAWLVARALGLGEVTLGATLAIVPVVSLLSAIPLVPGGWGVGELAFAYFFAPLGVAPSEAVGWSVAFRLLVLASGLPGGALWLLAKDHASRDVMAGEVAAAERAAEAPSPLPSSGSVT